MVGLVQLECHPRDLLWRGFWETLQWIFTQPSLVHEPMLLPGCTTIQSSFLPLIIAFLLPKSIIRSENPLEIFHNWIPLLCIPPKTRKKYISNARHIWYFEGIFQMWGCTRVGKVRIPVLCIRRLRNLRINLSCPTWKLLHLLPRVEIMRTLLTSPPLQQSRHQR